MDASLVKYLKLCHSKELLVMEDTKVTQLVSRLSPNSGQLGQLGHPAPSNFKLQLEQLL